MASSGKSSHTRPNTKPTHAQRFLERLGMSNQLQILVVGYLCHCFGRKGRGSNDISTIIYQFICKEIWNLQLLDNNYIESPTPYFNIFRITPQNGFWYNAFGTMRISTIKKDLITTYVWNLKYKSVSNNMDCMIGIVSNSQLHLLQNTVCNYYCFYNSKAFGLCQNGDIINDRRMIQYANKEFTSGDIITVQVAYKGTNGVIISFKINQKSFGTAFETVSDYYNLAVSLGDKHTSVCIENFYLAE
eukprot:499408_1